MKERVARVTGRPVRALRRIETRGYALAYHAIAEFDDGTTAFVKAGAEEVTSGFLRDELRFYADVTGPFMPRLLGFDASDPPVLVIEDLSGARWPPPWDEKAVVTVCRSLEQVWSTEPPQWVPPVSALRNELCGGWAMIEHDPQPFLSLGVCSPEWLEAGLSRLREAAETALIEGSALLHLDVRSDNLCIAERGAVLVDWNWVHTGNPDLDLAAWLPSLHLEGGPAPDAMLPGAGGFAAVLAGFFGSRAGLPPPPTAPQVREIQRAQLGVALAWAQRELRL